jgi:hypothetical protein
MIEVKRSIGANGEVVKGGVLTKAAGERRSGVANNNRMGGGIGDTCGRPIRGIIPIVRSVSGPGKDLAVRVGKKTQVNCE